MKSPLRSLSIFQKSIIALTIIFAAAAFEYNSFLVKSRKLELYDTLQTEVGSARSSIFRLQHHLEMIVVAWGLEYGSVDMLRAGMDHTADSLEAVVADPAYAGVLKEEGMLAESVRAVLNDISTIRAELRRLNEAMSREEMILLHNSVDTNTVLAAEKAERLLSYISLRKQAVFQEFKSLALKSFAGFAAFALVAALILYGRVFHPTRKAVLTARRILAGEADARFDSDDRSETGRLCGKLNQILEYLGKEKAFKDSECLRLRSALVESSGQISAIGSVISFAGRTLSESEVFDAALREVVLRTGAAGAAVYMLEGGGELRLKSVSGIPEGMAARLEDISLKGWVGGSAKVFDRNSPSTDFSGAFSGPGAELVAAAPLVYDQEAAGLLIAVYGDRTGYSDEHLAFLEATASAIAVISGHSALFKNERASRMLLERLIGQLPLGLAVFGLDGKCVIMNGRAKLMLGVSAGFEATAYSVLEDQVLQSQGMVTAINKSYDGYSTEFIINYSPISARELGLSAPGRRLRIRSFPVYGSGGEVSNLALIYEDMTESETVQSGGTDR
ncbi:MAG: GAF domain-containing protein [Deltaproteobacteria bacterium]|nr:GAF domain-containing protein [Deltaproteobacteria bacterium]MBZ0219105.1 GAF domain-containing protein [Deltaproteobacteria bacterium]